MKSVLLSQKSAARQLRHLFNFNSFYGLNFSYKRINNNYYSVTYVGEREEFCETRQIHSTIIDALLDKEKSRDKGCFYLVPTSLLW